MEENKKMPLNASQRNRWRVYMYSWGTVRVRKRAEKIGVKKSRPRKINEIQNANSERGLRRSNRFGVSRPTVRSTILAKTFTVNCSRENFCHEESTRQLGKQRLRPRHEHGDF